MSSEKVAIVTGANKGLGYAIVEGLCEKFDGAVYLTARDENRGQNACEELKKLGLSPVFHQLDITDLSSISKLTQHIKQKHGKVDILINNAGIAYLTDSGDPKIYQAVQTINVNVFSLINFCEAMLPLMKDGGTIVNISSSSGHLSRIPSEELRKKFSSPNLTIEELKDLMASYLKAVKEDKETDEGWGPSSYVVSKVAVNAYTFYLNHHLVSRGISVNCVHPGYVKSDMTRGAGAITPKEGARVPLRLALEPWGSGLYVWHNGQEVPWDGEDPRQYIDKKNLNLK